jgi:hypothetical protein
MGLTDNEYVAVYWECHKLDTAFWTPVKKIVILQEFHTTREIS